MRDHSIEGLEELRDKLRNWHDSFKEMAALEGAHHQDQRDSSVSADTVMGVILLTEHMIEERKRT